jgi:hypothetical protein
MASDRGSWGFGSIHAAAISYRCCGALELALASNSQGQIWAALAAARFASRAAGCEATDHGSCPLEVFCVSNSLCVQCLDKFAEQVLDIAQASLSGLVVNLGA